jgi:TolA-binding protein
MPLDFFYGRPLVRFRTSARPVAAAIVVAWVALPRVGHAQLESREAIELHNEILELRQEMSQLQQLPSQANLGQSSLPPPEPEGGPPPQAGGASSDVVAQLVVRVSALEEQMRTLEGRVSELENTEHRDHDDLAKQIGDLSFKLGQAPAGGGTAAPEAGTLGGTGATLAPSVTPPPAAAAPARRTPEVALKQGSAALARRDYSAAEAAAREVLALGHTARSADASFLLARAQAGQHQYKDAAATFFGVYKANPKSPRAAEALLGVANSLVGLSNMPLACQALAKLAAEFPREDASMRAGAASVRKRAGGCK